jgi:hypothetical protein
MYNYKFESIDFEEQYAFELKHERKFTSEELDEMVIKAIKEYVENEYDNYLLFPCNLDIGNLFFDGSLQDVLVRLFGFERIDYESRVEYGGEALFGDDFRHRDGKNFKEILKDVKVPKCEKCSKDSCLIENERF